MAARLGTPEQSHQNWILAQYDRFLVGSVPMNLYFLLFGGF
ncbi:MAG: hypothetical protein OXE52_05455 [Chloroflexi bacterium]|nr:hypothetical protein [Chloroflexota bacterium]